jgi:hypothetical protein
MAKRPPSACKRLTAVVMMRVPVAPKGWPRLRLPPHAFVRSMGMVPTALPGGVVEPTSHAKEGEDSAAEDGLVGWVRRREAG